MGDLSQMWVGGVADSQTRSKPLKTPPNHPENRPFRPEFHLSFSQISQKPWGGWVGKQIWERSPKKKRFFFGSFPYIIWCYICQELGSKQSDLRISVLYPTLNVGVDMIQYNSAPNLKRVRHLLCLVFLELLPPLAPFHWKANKKPSKWRSKAIVRLSEEKEFIMPL